MKRASRRAETQPQRLERIFGRTMSTECLRAQHFCLCPMLDCTCLCHEIDEEPRPSEYNTSELYEPHV